MFDPTRLSEASHQILSEFVQAYDDHVEALQLGVAIEGIWF